ncbi:U8 snoRNA-decapping enzyme-like [Oopsacas minuta]|uniref:U8 snoRNA-decapping enzyme n=1 Tax=Oopsacas minuta TaxID=111878 RepID=A0AAV7JTH6_9METZ|nr:U8 snoRNA-decapping enzyme-like [Oopsacas minuta]
MRFKLLMQSLYKQIDQIQSLKLEPRFRHAAHAALYARTDAKQFGKYPKYAHLLVQLRFDGTFGFTGGIVDEGETPLIAVNRESSEELGIPSDSLNITQEDYVITHYADELNLCLHFYAKEIKFDKIVEIESKCVKGKDYGNEVLGLIRVPLYTLPNGLGLPAFLGSQFIGSSRMNLLLLLKERNILPENELRKAIELSKSIKTVVSADDINI